MALTKHGHHIPGSGEDILSPTSVDRCGGPMMCRDCQKDCMNYREPPTSSTPAPTEDYYDEHTLQKVHDVLAKVGSIYFTPQEIISMLQNEGILFRERRP